MFGCSDKQVDNEPWNLTVEMAIREPSPGYIEVRVDWLGQTEQIPLADDGRKGDRIAADGIYSASFTGQPCRSIGVAFSRNENGKMIAGHRAIERVPWGGGVLSYGLVDLNNFTVQRLSSTGTESTIEQKEVTRTAAGVVWSWFCLLVALLLVGRGPKSLAEPNARTWPWWSVPLVFIVLSILWTWPAVLAGGSRGVGLHFDTYGTIWSVSAASRLLTDLNDTLTAWPIGAEHRNLDSFTLLPLAAAFAWVDPVRLHAWLGIGGIAASAWAAEHFAHQVGAKRPWSLIAGLTFAFSGLGATALLEGHVYHVINPWLPLFGLYWWKACGIEGRNRDSAYAAMFFVLTVLTTAYLGVAAGLIAIGFFVGAVARREANVTRAMIALGLVAPILFWLISGIVTENGDPESIHRILLGSSHLANLGIPTPEMDRAGHSVAAGLGGIAFALTMLAPIVLPERRYRVLIWTGCGALFLSFGPVLSLSPEQGLLPLPTYPLWTGSWLGHIRFPIRLLWAWLLCSGVITALVATRLANLRHAPLIALLVLAHSFLFVALPFRQSSVLTSSPSAYEGPASLAVLDLMGSGTDPSGEFDNWTSATSCVRQASHRRPIAENCVQLPVQQNPRMRIQTWVEDRLREGDSERIATELAARGFGHVAWYPDLYSPGDRVRFETVFNRWPEPTKTVDGGDHVWMYKLETASKVTTRFPVDSRSEQYGADRNENTMMEDLFVELHIPYNPNVDSRDESEIVSGWTDNAYRFEYRALDTTRSTDLSNEGVLPGDWRDDYIWTGFLPGQLPSRFVGTLFAGTPKTVEKVLWSGVVNAAGTNDRIAFVYTNSGVRPTTASADRPNPPARRGVGIVAAMGWSGWSLIVLLWFIKRRRERGTSSRVTAPGQQS